MKSGHDTDYQDDIHLLLQRLCTASDSVPKEQRFELGKGWSKMFIRQLFASNLSQEWHFPFTHSLLWNHCHAVHLVYRYLWGYLLPVKWNSKSQTEIKQGDMGKLHQKTVIEPQSEPFLPECQSKASTVELHLLLLSHPTVYDILGWPLKSKARHPQYQL